MTDDRENGTQRWPWQPSTRATDAPATPPVTGVKTAWWEKPIGLWVLIVTGVVGVVAGVVAGAAIEQHSHGGAVSTAVVIPTSTVTTASVPLSLPPPVTTTPKQSPPAARQKGVVHVSGTSDTKSDNFSVNGSWAITGTTADAGVRVAVYNADGNRLVHVGTPPPGDVNTQASGSGTFYLVVSSAGVAYDLSVVDLPD